jgi:hypothetical protein
MNSRIATKILFGATGLGPGRVRGCLRYKLRTVLSAAKIFRRRGLLFQRKDGYLLPLKRGKSARTIVENIREIIKAGYLAEQAVDAAYAMAGKKN